MNSQERRATLGLALVAMLRMFGMFAILPVFSPFALHLPRPATATEIGLAIGIYGVMQALLQIPLGLLSDRIGRKPVLVAGLLMFTLGSAVAGFSEGIEGIVLGRLLQGLGAISSAASALLADLTRESVRPMAMGMLGMGVGVAFLGALVSAPVLAAHLGGVPGIFKLTALCALLAIPLVLWLVPAAPSPIPYNGGVIRVLRSPRLLTLNAQVLLLHAALSGLFVVLPLALPAVWQFAARDHWQLYAPVLVASLALGMPLLRRGAPAILQRVPVLLPVGLGVMATALGLHASIQGTVILLGLGLLVFFVGFNVMEGSLPSLVSRQAPPGLRGAAMGAYSSCQFLGPLLGASLGAQMAAHLSLTAALWAIAALLLPWAVWSLRPLVSPAAAPKPSIL